MAVIDRASAQIVESDSRLSATGDADADPQSPRYEQPIVSRWRMGINLHTPVSFTQGLATFPLPTQWPEQSVRLLKQSSDARVTQTQVRQLEGGGAQQVVLLMPRVLSGSTIEVTYEIEITKRRILSPIQTESLIIPPRIDRPLKLAMGNSPNIDVTHFKIRGLARELSEQPVPNAWAKVRQIYDCVRERVKYTEGPIRNASDALADGVGDCEDMTSLFVALCRNSGIPARMVWVPGHCYPEFYLEQPAQPGRAAKGYWYPCQAAGSEQFGEMDETRPVLQKGDRFTVPENRGPVRYVSEFFRCLPAGPQEPRFEFIRKPIINAADSATLN